MPGTAAKIVLTDTMYEILQRIANSRTVGLSIVTRAKVILPGFSKQSNQEIAKQLDIERETVGRWRKRWRDSFLAMLAFSFPSQQPRFNGASKLFFPMHQEVDLQERSPPSRLWASSPWPVSHQVSQDFL